MAGPTYWWRGVSTLTRGAFASGPSRAPPNVPGRAIGTGAASPRRTCHAPAKSIVGGAAHTHAATMPAIAVITVFIRLPPCWGSETPPV